MNPWLRRYLDGVAFPESSGIEHLDMLEARDRLAAAELDPRERHQLREADQELLGKASLFLEELERFVDLPAYRQERGIGSGRWWWYLDVLAAAQAA